jgi:hypothetical protein
MLAPCDSIVLSCHSSRNALMDPKLGGPVDEHPGAQMQSLSLKGGGFVWRGYKRIPMDIIEFFIKTKGYIMI